MTLWPPRAAAIMLAEPCSGNWLPPTVGRSFPGARRACGREPSPLCTTSPVQRLMVGCQVCSAMQRGLWGLLPSWVTCPWETPGLSPTPAPGPWHVSPEGCPADTHSSGRWLSLTAHLPPLVMGGLVSAGWCSSWQPSHAVGAPEPQPFAGKHVTLPFISWFLLLFLGSLSPFAFNGEEFFTSLGGSLWGLMLGIFDHGNWLIKPI